ncbi:MAG: FeoA family protein [Candidatus Cloacimonadaceae bacterium]
MQHLFKRFTRGLGRGFGRRRERTCPHGPYENLSQAQENSAVTITCNNDHKTVERGLCTGVQVRVLRNEMDEPNLIVAVGDARYVLDRRIAHRIKVKVE